MSSSSAVTDKPPQRLGRSICQQLSAVNFPHPGPPDPGVQSRKWPPRRAPRSAGPPATPITGAHLSLALPLADHPDKFLPDTWHALRKRGEEPGFVLTKIQKLLRVGPGGFRIPRGPERAASPARGASLLQSGVPAGRT